MTPSTVRAVFQVFAAAAVSLLATVASAESFASSASSAGSKSVGSLSDSLTGSSNSSSGERKVAEGRYRIEQLADIADKPGHLRLHLRLHLQAAATPGAGGVVLLDLPRQAVESQGLAAQATIELRQRPYGMEVAHQKTAAAAPAAFFLLLADAWRNDLQTRAVTL